MERRDKYCIESKKVLAVEGKDEKNFFEAFLLALNLESIQVIDIGGEG